MKSAFEITAPPQQELEIVDFAHSDLMSQVPHWVCDILGRPSQNGTMPVTTVKEVTEP